MASQRLDPIGAKTAGFRRTPCTDNRLLRVRLTEFALCPAIVRQMPVPSQIMCAGNRPLLRVGPFIIVRRYT